MRLRIKHVFIFGFVKQKWSSKNESNTVVRNALYKKRYR